jgi:hypothetical protein
MPQKRTVKFDPARVAYYEATGWRAYYDRKWFKLLRLIVGMCQEQFGIPFPVSLLAAYYTTRAAIAWVPVDHDEQRVTYFYRKFYRLAKKYSGQSYDPDRAGELETRYNEVHRRLVGQPDKSEFIEVMTRLHSVLFGISPEAARESAELRVLANNTVDQITGKKSQDIEGDWQRIEEYLRRCYESVNSAALKA